MKNIDTKDNNHKVLIVGLITPTNRFVDVDSYFDEFRNLVKSNGVNIYREYFTKLRSIDSRTFLTKGKLEEIKSICLEDEIDEVIISEIITPQQESILEKELGLNIFDRTGLILEIFEKQARSAEAKIQIEIAFLEFKKTRVSGRGKYFSQQSGRKGTVSGAGETQKEIDLQHLDHLLLKLKRDLIQLEKIRDTQRKQRLKNLSLQKISIIGYTNAGKSTLFNTLVKENVLVEDRLFATLDTTTRELFHNHKKIGLISDTVGFIQNLPPQLIEAFNTTLQELKFSDILIHVIDLSDRNWQAHIETVNNVLNDLEIKNKRVLYALNKIDKLTAEQIENLKNSFPQPYFLISANDKETLNDLLNFISPIEGLFEPAKSYHAEAE